MDSYFHLQKEVFSKIALCDKNKVTDINKASVLQRSSGRIP